MVTGKKRGRLRCCAAAALGLLAAAEVLLFCLPAAHRGCPVEQLTDAYRFYILCTATGESFPMDLYSRGEDPAAAEDTHSIVLSIQDKASGSAVFLLKSPGRASGLLLAQRGDGKTLPPEEPYCASCLPAIAAAVEQSGLPAFVLYDRGAGVFYPVDGLPAALGGYLCETTLAENGYQVAIAWAG